MEQKLLLLLSVFYDYTAITKHMGVCYIYISLAILSIVYKCDTNMKRTHCQPKQQHVTPSIVETIIHIQLVHID